MRDRFFYNFPSHIQHDAMDCGPVSLQMIAQYYGKNFSLDKLRQLTYTVKDGVSLFAISEAAEQIGFKTVGGKLTFAKLEKEALLPCIVHWNQEHFVNDNDKENGLRMKNEITMKEKRFSFFADPQESCIC